MKRKYTIYILLFALIALCYVLNVTMIDKRREMNVISLPSLPMPIAKEYALITSAGQGTDAYIVNDVANKALIHNYFMPQAKETDLEGIHTIVFVISFSPIGERLHSISYDEELDRVKGLLERAKKEDIVILSIYLGGMQQRLKETDEFIRLIASEADYMIASKEANKDGYLSTLAKENKMPLTLVNKVNDLIEPFTSAFR